MSLRDAGLVTVASLVLVGLALLVRQSWRRPYVTKGVPRRWSWGEGLYRAKARTRPLLFVLAGLMFIGLPIAQVLASNEPISDLVLWSTLFLMLVTLALMGTVALFNVPSLVVPPSLQNDRGAASYWLATLGNRRKLRRAATRRLDLMREGVSDTARVFAGIPFTLSLALVLTLFFIAELWPTFDSALVFGRRLSPLEISLGVSSREVLSGEWWRLFTAGLVHAGLPHLLSNVTSLVLIGGVAEQRLGAVYAGAMFLLGLLGGNAAALITTMDSRTITVGASGGIFALLAGVLVTLPHSRPSWTEIAIFLTVVGGVLVTSALHPNVSTAGHVGGVLAGVVAGLGVRWWQLHRPWSEDAAG